MNRPKTYWAGFIEGKLDTSGWMLGSRKDSTDLVSIFRTRKTAREAFQDVRAVHVVLVEAPKRKLEKRGS